MARTWQVGTPVARDVLETLNLSREIEAYTGRRGLPRRTRRTSARARWDSVQWDLYRSFHITLAQRSPRAIVTIVPMTRCRVIRQNDHRRFVAWGCAPAAVTR